MAQEEENENESEELKHLIALSFGYTYIPNGAELDAAEANGYLPTIGFDYFYRFSPRGEIGIMMDVELDHYLVVDKDLERENAIIVVLIGIY